MYGCVGKAEGRFIFEMLFCCDFMWRRIRYVCLDSLVVYDLRVFRVNTGWYVVV